MSEASRSTRLIAAAVGALIVVAFVLRLVMRLTSGESDFWANSYSAYYEMARNVVSGYGLCIDRIGMKCAYWPPVYPLFLAGTILVGTSYITIIAVQSAVGAATTLCAFALGRRLFGPVEGLLAAALCAVYPYYVVHDTALQETSIVTLLTAAAVLFLLDTQRSARAIPPLLGGILLGMATLTRASIAPFGLLALAWVATVGSPRGQRLRTTLLVAVPFMLLVGSWLIRTQLVVGSPMLSSQAGRFLWIGNSPHTFAFYPAASIDRSEAVAWAALSETEVDEVQRLGEADQSAWFARRGSTYIATHISSTLQAAWVKIAAAYSWMLSPNREPWVQLAYGIAYGPISVLAIIGAALAWRGWRSHALIYLLVASFTATSAIFWAHTSHRSILDVYFMVFAGHALVATGRILVRRLRLSPLPTGAHQTAA